MHSDQVLSCACRLSHIEEDVKEKFRPDRATTGGDCTVQKDSMASRSVFADVYELTVVYRIEVCLLESVDENLESDVVAQEGAHIGL